MAAQTAMAVPRKEQAKIVRKIEPSSYLFRLTGATPKEFSTGTNNQRTMIARTNNILWAYINDKPVKVDMLLEDKDLENIVYKSRTMRYVAGHPSIFIDEQEEYGRAWEETDNRLTNTQNYDNLTFFKRELRVPSYDKTRFNFLRFNSYCETRDPKAKPFTPVTPLFSFVDYGHAELEKINKVELKTKAYNIALDARNEEMIPHAKFLNISLNYDDSDEQREFQSIKSDYIDKALSDPETFLKHFGDPSLKLIHWIRLLIDKNEITAGDILPGHAHWVKTKSMISEFPTDVDPVKFLADYALTKPGEAFQKLLKQYNEVM